MDRHAEAFLEMLSAERGAAGNTLLAYAADLAKLTAHAESRGESLLTCRFDTIREFLAGETGSGMSSRTIGRRRSCFQQFYRFLLREGLRTDDPISLTVAPRRSQVLPNHLNVTELDALFAAAASLSPSARLSATAMLELLYGTGLRISELLSLRRTGFLAATDVLAVKGKGGRERLVPLSRRAREAGCALLAATAGPWLFAGRDETRPMTRQGLGVLLKRLARKAGVDPARVSPHVIRHTFATDMLANGADVRSLQLLLGHADISTTQIYTHVQHRRLTALVQEAHPLSGAATTSQKEKGR